MSLYITNKTQSCPTYHEDTTTRSAGSGAAGGCREDEDVAFIAFPSESELEEMIQKELYTYILPWKELIIAKWYRAERVTKKITKFGLKNILQLVDRDACKILAWAPESIVTRLANRPLPVYIRNNGMKTCVQNPGRLYYDVDIA